MTTAVCPSHQDRGPGLGATAPRQRPAPLVDEPPPMDWEIEDLLGLWPYETPGHDTDHEEAWSTPIL